MVHLDGFELGTAYRLFVANTRYPIFCFCRYPISDIRYFNGYGFNRYRQEAEQEAAAAATAGEDVSGQVLAIGDCKLRSLLITISAEKYRL